ncbi:FAD-dependent oxidoreductase [Pseudoxanthomonas sp. CCNWLY206-1]
MTTARTLPVWGSLTGFTEAHFVDRAPVGQQDVVVIGAGIAGLSTAVCLAREGRQVTVIDRQGLGEGETLRTTAHLASALDDRFYQLARWHGEVGARLAAASHVAAIDWIEDIATSALRDCGFQRVPGFLFPHDGSCKPLQQELRAARRAGLRVDYLEEGLPELPGFGPILRFEDQARVDIASYLLTLAETAQASGVRFHRARVGEVQGGASPALVLDTGERIAAAAVVVATNVPFHETVALHTKQAAYRTYVVAGRAPRGAVPDALMWDDGDPYHYVRLHDPGDNPDEVVVIVGGEDHKTGQEDDPTAYVRLQEWTRERFPAVTGFTHAWSGQIIEPADGLAFIGADAGGMDNVYVATGDSGNGITHGTIAGLLISDLIQGRENPWAELYDPRRKIVKSAGEWMRENANVVLQYRDWIAPGDQQRLDELALGDGAVIRRGFHRVAVYRDGSGALHAYSARCTHLGCAVRWSATEKSWDCPCHGSRFDAVSGKVLNGPAEAPLASFELEDAAIAS